MVGPRSHEAETRGPFSGIVQLEGDIVRLIEQYQPGEYLSGEPIGNGVYLHKTTKEQAPTTPYRSSIHLQKIALPYVNVESLTVYHCDRMVGQPGIYPDKIGSFYWAWDFLGSIPGITTLNCFQVGAHLDPRTKEQADKVLREDPKLLREQHLTMYYVDDSGMLAAKIFRLPEFIKDDRQIVGRTIGKLGPQSEGTVANLKDPQNILLNWILDTDIEPGEAELLESLLDTAKEKLHIATSGAENSSRHI